MDLSIVIINWNTCEMLSDCLQTVYNSIDILETEALLAKKTKNQGFAATNNQVLKPTRVTI